MTAASRRSERQTLLDAIDKKVAEVEQLDAEIAEADRRYEAALDHQAANPHENDTMLTGRPGYQARLAGRKARERQGDVRLLLERLYERKRQFEAEDAVEELRERTAEVAPVWGRIEAAHTKAAESLVEVLRAYLEAAAGWQEFADLKGRVEDTELLATVRSMDPAAAADWVEAVAQPFPAASADGGVGKNGFLAFVNLLLRAMLYARGENDGRPSRPRLVEIVPAVADLNRPVEVWPALEKTVDANLAWLPLIAGTTFAADVESPPPPATDTEWLPSKAEQAELAALQST